MTKLTHDTEINLAGVMGYLITLEVRDAPHLDAREQCVVSIYRLRSSRVVGPALESLPRLGFKVNLTMPLKQEASQNGRRIDPVGKLMGAVSCIVVRQDNSLLGVNNDWLGFRQSKLHLPRMEIDNTVALVLGAGGGGLAIVYALVHVKEIVITNRSQEQQNKLLIFSRAKISRKTKVRTSLTGR